MAAAGHIENSANYAAFNKVVIRRQIKYVRVFGVEELIGGIIF